MHSPLVPTKLFTHWFNNYLLSDYSMPGTTLGDEAEHLKNIIFLLSWNFTRDNQQNKYMWWFHRGITGMKFMLRGEWSKIFYRRWFSFQCSFLFVLLRNNWHTSLYKFKGCSMTIQWRGDIWTETWIIRSNPCKNLTFKNLFWSTWRSKWHCDNYQLTCSGLNHLYGGTTIYYYFFLWD